MGIARFFENVEFGGRNKVKDITFEEELVSIFELIPIVTFDNIQVSISIVAQETNVTTPILAIMTGMKTFY